MAQQSNNSHTADTKPPNRTSATDTNRSPTTTTGGGAPPPPTQQQQEAIQTRPPSASFRTIPSTALSSYGIASATRDRQQRQRQHSGSLLPSTRSPFFSAETTRRAASATHSAGSSLLRQTLNATVQTAAAAILARGPPASHRTQRSQRTTVYAATPTTSDTSNSNSNSSSNSGSQQQQQQRQQQQATWTTGTGLEPHYRPDQRAANVSPSSSNSSRASPSTTVRRVPRRKMNNGGGGGGGGGGFSSAEEDSRGPADQLCCLIDDGEVCRNAAGNASYSKRIQKTVAQRRLKLTIAANAPHIYICDFHKSRIQCARTKRRRKDSEDDSNETDTEVPDVDLYQLQVNTLRRYKRYHKVQTRPGMNKAQLADTILKHFKSLPVKEKECLSYFIYMVKTNSNKLDQKNGIGGGQQPDGS